VITVSDTRREAQDRSGALAVRLLAKRGHAVVMRAWVPDDVRAIRAAAREALARPNVDCVILTGGTGVSPRDRTPEAVAPLVSAWLPGFGELFRTLSLDQVGAAAWLSRAAAGVAKQRLLVILPGSTPAVKLAMESLLLPELAHVMRMLGRFRTGE